MEKQEAEVTPQSNQTGSAEFKNYFKYCSDVEQVINGLFQQKKIRFTQPWALNDPLEFNPSIRFDPGFNIHAGYDLDGFYLPSYELWLRTQIIESQINDYGILSLSKKPNAFDMWSRYANGHKGFLIEFDAEFNKHPCMKSTTGAEYPIEKVIYVEDYAISLDELTANYNGEIPFEELRKTFFYKKTSRWKHEDEYRLVRPLADSCNYEPLQKDRSYRDDQVYLFDFSLECIASITFGPYMSVSNKQKIESSCKGHDIAFLQATIVRDKRDQFGLLGTILISLVDDFGPRSRFYSMQPQVFCSDASGATRGDLIRIQSLSELPYFERNEEVVNEVWKRIRLTS